MAHFTMLRQLFQTRIATLRMRPNIIHYILHCLLPLAALIVATPLFFVAWSSCQLLTLFRKTRPCFIKFDTFFWGFYQRLVLFFTENWSNTDIILYGDVPEHPNERRERTIFICNHQCSFDWIIADIVAIRHNCLGNLRYILKNSLRHIPIFGYFFRLHGCIYVKRGDHDEQSFRKQLVSLAQRGIYWLVIFPEGTRFRKNCKQGLAKNREYAEKFNLPTFDLVLTPRHRGFYHSVQSLGSSLDAVYDITIAYEPPEWTPDGTQPDIPSMASYLVGACRRLHIHLKRIPIDEVPKDEHKFVAWLCDRYKTKDEILKRFYARGGALVGDEIPEPSRMSPMKETVPYLLVALLVTLFLWTSEVGRWFYASAAFFSTIFTFGWMALVPDRYSILTQF